MTYREFRPRAELADLAVCTWERRVPADADTTPTRVVPDGCVDLVWHAGELIVAGPDLAPFMSPLPPGSAIVGLRLRPGVAGSVLGIPASELRDLRVPLEAVWGKRGAGIAERVALAGPPSVQRRMLEDAMLARRSEARPADRAILAATRLLGRPGVRIGELAKLVGFSDRQLRRRFDVEVGYGPKALDRVLRFQRVVSVLPSISAGDTVLARLAAELGYADQAHLTRECTRLSGLAPRSLAAVRAG